MSIDRDLLVLVTSPEWGDGPSDLGERLTGLGLKCLAAADTRPAKMIFLNSGIFLTTEGSSVVEYLRALEDRGTEIVSCITCLTYHDRMERIVVGGAGDMQGAIKEITSFRKVVTL